MNDFMNNLGIIIGVVLALWGIFMYIKKEPIGFKPNYQIKDIKKYCTTVGLTSAVIGSVYVILELLPISELILISVELVLLGVLVAIEMKARKL